MPSLFLYDNLDYTDITFSYIRKLKNDNHYFLPTFTWMISIWKKACVGALCVDPLGKYSCIWHKPTYLPLLYHELRGHHMVLGTHIHGDTYTYGDTIFFLEGFRSLKLITGMTNGTSKQKSMRQSRFFPHTHCFESYTQWVAGYIALWGQIRKNASFHLTVIRLTRRSRWSLEAVRFGFKAF